MMSVATIKNILAQVEETSFHVGHFTGHVISLTQVRVIYRELDSLFKSSVPPPPPSYRGAEASLDIAIELQQLRSDRLSLDRRMRAAGPVDRIPLNKQIGTLDSRIARLEKALV